VSFDEKPRVKVVASRCDSRR